MEKQSRIAKFKQEFSEEINATELKVEDLKNAKVSKEVMSAEASLRRVFGDEIFERKIATDSVEGEKEIFKLNEEDIAFDSEVQQICDDLVDLNFETEVNVLLSKIAEQEEE